MLSARSRRWLFQVVGISGVVFATGCGRGLACGALVHLDDFKNQCGGDLDADCTPDAGATGSGGSPDAGTPCKLATDCPGADTDCAARACLGGVCSISFSAAATKLATQTPGDCRVSTCDGQGNVIHAIDDTDVPDDGKACTKDLCAKGTPSNPPDAKGTKCGDGNGVVCDGAGVCVACVDGSTCPSHVCDANVCATPTCEDKVQNGAETAVDCGGGTCAACDLTKTCAKPGDCLSKHCVSATCVPAACDDQITDGAETDVDCGGGSCATCPPNAGCGGNGDCAGGLCSGGMCAATCTDKVKNEGETGTDCGGPCSPCADGGGCMVGPDCVSKVCSGGTCLVPTCLDKVENGTETDVDCGGGSCPLCVDTKKCGTSGDCTSDVCRSGVCTSSCGWSVDLTGTGDPQTPGIAVTSGGETIVVGAFNGTQDLGLGSEASAGSNDAFVTKWDAAGKVAWIQTFGDAKDQGASSVGTDSAGNVFITGYFAGSTSFGGPTRVSAASTSAFVAKLGPDGSYAWDVAFGVLGTIEGTAIAVDDGGSVYVGGYAGGSVDFGAGTVVTQAKDAFLVKLDSVGSVVWAKLFGDAANDTANQRIRSIAVDGTGNVVIAGVFTGAIDLGDGPMIAAMNLDDFVGKFDPSGNLLWSKHIVLTESQIISHSHPPAPTITVAPDSLGNVWTAGSFPVSFDFGNGATPGAGAQNAFFVKLDASGNVMSSAAFGDANTSFVVPSAALDASGDVLLATYVAGTIDFGGGPLDASANRQMALAKFDPSGKHLWSRLFNDGAGMGVSGLAAYAQHDVAVTGWFTGTLDLGCGPLANPGVFVAKLAVP